MVWSSLGVGGHRGRGHCHGVVMGAQWFGVVWVLIVPRKCGFVCFLIFERCAPLFVVGYVDEGSTRPVVFGLVYCTWLAYSTCASFAKMLMMLLCPMGSCARVIVILQVQTLPQGAAKATILDRVGTGPTAPKGGWVSIDQLLDVLKLDEYKPNFRDALRDVHHSQVTPVSTSNQAKVNEVIILNRVHM